MFEGISTQNTKKPEAVEVISYEYDKIKRAHINALSKYISPHHGTSLNNFSLYDIIYDAAEMIAPGTTDSILRELLQSLERFSISDLVQFSIEIQAIEKQVEDFLSELVLFQKQQQEENATVREMTEEMMKIDMKERAKLNDDMQTAIDSTETLKDLCIRQEISLMGKWNAAKRTLLYDFTPKINQLLENLKTAARVDEHIPPHEMRRPVQRKFANEVISQKVDTFRLKLLEFLKSEAFNQLGHPMKIITACVIHDFIRIADALFAYVKHLNEILLNATQVEVEIKMYSKQLSMLHAKSNEACKKTDAEVEKLEIMMLVNTELFVEWMCLQKDITP